MGTWLLLSGHYDAFHIGLGVFSSLLVTISTCKLFPAWDSKAPSGLSAEIFFQLRWTRVALYFAILLKNIVVANLKVAALILHPRIPIDPIILRFHTTLQTTVARVLLGNSITLTPGTLTLDVEDSFFQVHALNADLAASLIDGSDQNRTAAVFGDAQEKQAKILISRSFEEGAPV